MAFGIDTFIFHLDQITDPAWDAFKIWNGGKLVDGKVTGGDPAFAGRNFIGNDYLWGHAEATDASKELKGRVGPADPSPAHPENLTLRVPLIAPIQAPEPSRQQMTDRRGFLYGALDAQAIYRKVFWSIVAGEFEIPPSGHVQIWLAVNADTVLSGDYWAGWSDQVNNFWVFLPVRTLHPTRILQPFQACILCPYTTEQLNGKLKRDPRVTLALDAARKNKDYGARDTTCHGFWADAPDLDDEDGVHPNPRLDWTRFAADEMPSLWRFALGIQSAGGIGINERFFVDAAKDPTEAPVSRRPKATEYMLVTKKWQPNVPTIVNPGFSGLAEITAERLTCMQGTPIPEMRSHGNDFTVPTGFARSVGRYLKIPNLAITLSAGEATRLSDGGFELFTVWESVNSRSRLQPTTIGPFNPVFHAGTEDGMSAFTYCGEVLHQPPQTPVFFAVDFDPGVGATARAWIENYFRLVAAARDAYAQRNPDRYYLIGAYASGEALRWCYEQGLVSSFWQTVSFAFNGSEPPRWPWYHANRWQYQYTDDKHPLPAPWNCVPGADPDVDWGDGGTWSLADPVAQSLRQLEQGEAGIHGFVGLFGDLVRPLLKRRR